SNVAAFDVKKCFVDGGTLDTGTFCETLRRLARQGGSADLKSRILPGRACCAQHESFPGAGHSSHGLNRPLSLRNVGKCSRLLVREPRVPRKDFGNGGARNHMRAITARGLDSGQKSLFSLKVRARRVPDLATYAAERHELWI